MSGMSSEDPEPARGLAVTLALAAIALVLLVATKHAPGSWADASRLATIESIAERGTLAIDDSTYLWQGDKVRFDGHFYSHQPPMLAVLGALPYLVLHATLGLDIDDPWTYRLLTLVLVGLPVWLGLRELERLLRLQGLGGGARALLVALVFFGTHLLPYSLVLNQHGTAAGLACLGLGAIERKRHLLAGLLLAVATTVDLTAVFCALAFLLPVLATGRLGGVLRYGAGALPALALHFSLNHAVAGDFTPFGMHEEAFRYAGSPFMLMSLTGVAQAEQAGAQAAYLVGATVGPSGLFSHHPWLLVAIIGGLIAAALRPNLVRGRLPVGVLSGTALAALGIAAYYLTQSRNFGGSSFGMRWFTVFCPFAALWAGAALVSRGGTLPRSLLALLVLAPLCAWSVAAAGLGAVNPWTKFHYVYELSPMGRVPREGDDRPQTWGEHLRREWLRIQRKERFDQQEYDQTLTKMIEMHRRMYLRPVEQIGEERRVELAREGIERLQPVLDLMDAENLLLGARAHGHFWLGKLFVAAGDTVRAEKAYRTAIFLDPLWQAPRVALDNL